MSDFRTHLLAVLSIAAFLVLAARLADLSIVRARYYNAIAESQRKRASELMPHRGVIYVTENKKGGEADVFPIASNIQAWTAYAVPREMDRPEEVAQELAPALLAFRQRQQQRLTDITAATGQLHNPRPAPSPETTASPVSPDTVEMLLEQLKAKFDQKSDPYEPLLKPYEVLDDEFKSFLENKRLPGLVLEEEEVRVYPEKSLAAQLLGYVGYQDSGRVGRYGIEGYYDKQLAGSLGLLAAERDAAGRFIGVGQHNFTPARNGDDIVLTVDRVIQSYLEQELKSGVERYGAERGSAIVMDPATGAILGMATYPSYDPNYYYAIKDPRVQLNPVISDLFEPGSILKPVVMAAAIAEGKVTPDTTMVDNGPVKVADRVINTFDGKHYGVQTMTQILEQSNNVGMVWLGQQIGAETMYDYFRRFGLGEKTGIELEGETQTQLPEPDRWNVTTLATSSFGQGVALTPLQALNAVSALANRGELMQPYIVSEIRHPDGSVERTNPVRVRQVVPPETADKLSAMMVSVIENGVARLARLPGYYLAGKTGTAQVPDERGKYSPDRKIISFVGFGPTEKPQFAVLIKLDNPAGLSFASGTAAPMFRNIMEKLLQYYQIPPSYDVGKKYQPVVIGQSAG